MDETTEYVGTKLEFRRGDTFAFKFQRKNTSSEVIETETEKIWFSVKKNYKSKTTLFQLTLNNGITYDDETYYYHAIIESSHTRNLNFGSYVYDIQVMNGNVVKTIAYGKLKLNKEVTTDYE